MSYYDHSAMMRDDLDDHYPRRPAQRKRVNIHEPQDVVYWTSRFDCTPGQLMHAVRAVGVDPIDVLVYLERK